MKGKLSNVAHRLKFCCALIALLILCASAARAGSWAQGSVSNAAGTRNYKLWVPTNYDQKKLTPLVLMLHGCTQTPDDFAAGTNMNAVADANNFLVAYPEQPSSANPLKCWNWFDPAHQARDAGEPSLLVAVVKRVQTTHNVDDLHTYAAGISAGGAMAVTLGAAYPELFAAIGVSAGLEYKAAKDVTTALAAGANGGADPNAQGLQAYQAMLKFQGSTAAATIKRAPRSFYPRVRRLMRVIVFQGALDAVVRPINADQVISQWAQTNDLLDDANDNNSVDDHVDSVTNGAVPNGHSFTRYVYTDAKGKPMMEKWIVQNMRHAWAGGLTAGTYTDPKAPDASKEIWRFFQQTQPTPAITSKRKRR